MFQHITIEGLGPHESFATDLSADGVTTIIGRSQSGKSTLLAALCFVLWGAGTDGRPFDVASINDSSDAADVTVTTAEGMKLRRRITGKRSASLYVDGERVSSGVFTEAIGKLAHLAAADKSTELTARLVLVPGAWQALASSAGGGRALRDVLASVTPGSLRDEVERLMVEAGHALDKSDIIDAKQAEKVRRAANSDADRSRGRAEEAAEQARAVASQVPQLVSVERVDAAKVVVHRESVWASYSTEKARHERAVADAERANEAADHWQSRIDALGPEPTVDTDAIEAARASVRTQEAEVQRLLDLGHSTRNLLDVAEDSLQQDFDTADREISRQQDAARDARAHLADLERAGDVCPTCHRDGWTEAAKSIEAQREVVAEAERVAAASLAGRDAQISELRELAAPKIDELAVKRESIIAQLTEARAELEVRTATRATVEQSAGRLGDWLREKRAIGDRPSIVDVPEAPRAPAFERPTSDDVVAAHALLAGSQAARTRVEEHGRRCSEAREREVQAAETYAADKARAEWAAALVDAIRRAPGEKLRRGLDALGDLGPVTIEVPEDGAAIRVLLDGREWHHASSGRRTVGDLHFRLALRRAFGLEALPVVVDDVGRWSGEWPKGTAPSVWLITAARDLTVTVKSAIPDGSQS